MSNEEYLLEDMSNSHFQKEKYPKMDALVAIIAEGKEPPAQIKRTVDDAGADLRDSP